MSYKITVPEGYPKLVTGAWKCSSDGSIVCLKKYVISGVIVYTSDGAEHTVPVSEFRVAPEGSTLEDTDCHFVDTGVDADNLVLLEECVKALASKYEDATVVGVDSETASVASDEVLKAYGYDKGETVELPSGSEITVEA